MIITDAVRCRKKIMNDLNIGWTNRLKMLIGSTSMMTNKPYKYGIEYLYIDWFWRDFCTSVKKSSAYVSVERINRKAKAGHASGLSFFYNM